MSRGEVMTLRAKSITLIGFLGLLCFLLPGPLQADTIYTYTGNAYTSCSGTYTCTGTSPFLSATLDVAAGTPLANLPPVQNGGGGANITADILSFSITDGAGLSLTQANTTLASFLIGTDASGDIASWDIFASTLGSSGPTMFAQTFSIPSIQFSTDQSGTSLNNGTFRYGENHDPGTWVMATTPEPSSLILLGTGFLSIVGVWRWKASAKL